MDKSDEIAKWLSLGLSEGCEKISKWALIFSDIKIPESAPEFICDQNSLLSK